LTQQRQLFSYLYRDTFVGIENEKIIQ